MEYQAGDEQSARGALVVARLLALGLSIFFGLVTVVTFCIALTDTVNPFFAFAFAGSFAAATVSNIVIWRLLCRAELPTSPRR